MLKTFDEVFDDYTKYGTKIKTEQYHTIGTNIIIDQGQSDIAGYTDQSDGLFTDVPVIVFGDHTRIIKYINRPFFLGADGTKILKSKIPDANYKYLYYALKNAKIPNTGYNRHFKWLKQISISYPEYQKQRIIVEILDKLEDNIGDYNTILRLLDELVKARFVEMFGTPYGNEKGFPMMTVDDVIEFTGGAQPDKKYFEYEATADNIRLIQIRDYKTDSYVTYIPRSMAKRFCNADDIMIGRYGPPIFQILKGIEGAYNVALMKATPKRGNKEFIRYFLKQDCLFTYLDKLSQRTAGQSGIEMPALKAYPFPYPPVELQEQFADFVQQVDKSKYDDMYIRD